MSPTSASFGVENPIFIVGALRSGTTVFRLMLGFHDEISNLGEGDFIFDYLRKPENGHFGYDYDALAKNRVFRTRKLQIVQSDNARTTAIDLVAQSAREKQSSSRAFVMSVHRNADKIAALFPNSKVLHIIRDPRDVAKSCIGMGWAGNPFYGVDGWLKTESNWDAAVGLFDKRNVMEIRFEDLIANPEARLRDVCQFLGLPFSKSMLDYHKGSTYEAPDSSTIQQWKKKLSPRDAALVELKAKPLLLARNYQLSGHPLEPPGVFERTRLFWDNKIYKWKFGCSRYGVSNFVLEKITRRFTPRLHDKVQSRINEISTSNLK